MRCGPATCHLRERVVFRMRELSPLPALTRIAQLSKRKRGHATRLAFETSDPLIP